MEKGGGMILLVDAIKASKDTTMAFMSDEW